MDNYILDIECKGMKNKEKFPIEYTGRGENISPEFNVKNLSENAKSLVITLEDLTHPINKFTHWIIWNVPAANKIPGAIKKGAKVKELNNARQGIAYGFQKYAGPKPPKGKIHRYIFTFYAIDSFIEASSFSTKSKILKLIDKHIIQKGEIEGYFE